MVENELGNSGLRAAPIGFGCSALLGRASRSESLRALAAAWDEGIRLFDVARSYGYGQAEALLGEFLGGKRDQAIIVTKFGIVAAPQPRWKQAAKAIARRVVAVAPSARALLRKGAAGQFSANQFTLQVLQESIEASLKALRTEYVDMLLLHAAPASVLQQDDLLDAMSCLVDAGKVRLCGLASDPEVVEIALQQTPSLRAMQFPSNVFGLDSATRIAASNSRNCALIGNHPMGGTERAQRCKAILQRLAEQPGLEPELRGKLARIDDTVLGDVILNVILRDTGIHAVVVSMMKVEHIKSNVRAIDRSIFTSGEIQVIRSLLLNSQPSPAAQ